MYVFTKNDKSIDLKPRKVNFILNLYIGNRPRKMKPTG